MVQEYTLDSVNNIIASICILDKLIQPCSLAVVDRLYKLPESNCVSARELSHK